MFNTYQLIFLSGGMRVNVIVEMRDGKQRIYQAMPDAAGLARILSGTGFIRVVSLAGQDEILNTAEIVRVIYEGAE